MQFKQAFVAAFAMATLTISAPVDLATSNAEAADQVANVADPAAEGYNYNSYYKAYGNGKQDLAERSVENTVEAKHHTPYATKHLGERADQGTVESKHHGTYERDVKDKVHDSHHISYSSYSS
ncbi:MAG: hypothetical protein Q9213_007002 [Squamulea squamosa]